MSFKYEFYIERDENINSYIKIIRKVSQISISEILKCIIDYNPLFSISANCIEDSLSTLEMLKDIKTEGANIRVFKVSMNGLEEEISLEIVFNHIKFREDILKEIDYSDEIYLQADLIEDIKKNYIKIGFSEEETHNFFREADPSNAALITNLYETFSFYSQVYQKEELDRLKEIDLPINILNFYYNYEPYELPILEAGFHLLNIQGIIEENSTATPSCYLIKHGILTFGTTIGGHAICMDFNTITDFEPSVIIVDHTICHYNENTGIVEIWDTTKDFVDEEDNILSPAKVRKYCPEISPRFSEFLEMVANNEIEDIEDYLEW